MYHLNSVHLSQVEWKMGVQYSPYVPLICLQTIPAGIQRRMPRRWIGSFALGRPRTLSSIGWSPAARWRKRSTADRSSRTPSHARPQAMPRIPTGESWLTTTPPPPFFLLQVSHVNPPLTLPSPLFATGESWKNPPTHLLFAPLFATGESWKNPPTHLPFAPLFLLQASHDNPPPPPPFFHFSFTPFSYRWVVTTPHPPTFPSSPFLLQVSHGNPPAHLPSAPFCYRWVMATPPLTFPLSPFLLQASYDNPPTHLPFAPLFATGESWQPACL